MIETKVYCTACMRLCAARRVAGETRPCWHKHAGRTCDGTTLPGKPSGIPAPPATVRVPLGALLDAQELLEELQELPFGPTCCPLCGAPAGCSHAHECLVERARAVRTALDVEGQGERAA